MPNEKESLRARKPVSSSVKRCITSGKANTVLDPLNKQAIAIGLSKARRAGANLPAPEKGTVSETTRRNARRAYQAGQRRKPKTSRRRSRASELALKREPRKAASSKALSRQARSAARRRTRTERSTSARRAARTKGRRGRSAAARKAARTRAHRG